LKSIGFAVIPNPTITVARPPDKSKMRAAIAQMEDEFPGIVSRVKHARDYRQALKALGFYDPRPEDLYDCELLGQRLVTWISGLRRPRTLKAFEEYLKTNRRRFRDQLQRDNTAATRKLIALEMTRFFDPEADKPHPRIRAYLGTHLRGWRRRESGAPEME
jgi:hypothetical protein